MVAILTGPRMKARWRLGPLLHSGKSVWYREAGVPFAAVRCVPLAKLRDFMLTDPMRRWSIWLASVLASGPLFAADPLPTQDAGEGLQIEPPLLIGNRAPDGS